jgi:hypothetical protein
MFPKVSTVTESEPKIEQSEGDRPGGHKKLTVRQNCQPEIGILASFPPEWLRQ